MRVNVRPGDVLIANTKWLGARGALIANTQWLGARGAPPQFVRIQKDDVLFVVACVAAAPRTTGEVFVDDIELLGAHYPDRYYVQALWRDCLIETIVITDSPFCRVIREVA